MYQSSYITYIKDILTLTKSLVIKSSVLAKSINRTLIENGIEVSANESEWKYYLNQSGLYHVTDNSRIMSSNLDNGVASFLSAADIVDEVGYIWINSLDTLEMIPFTKDTLAQHPTTLRIYKEKSFYYDSLIKQYSKFITLINGILNPVDMDDILAAKDGDILGYDKSLIERNEHDLLDDLTVAIKDYIFNYWKPYYTKNNRLFDIVCHSQMMATIPSMILNLRHAKVNSVQAHSFHVTMKLASFMGLDRYYKQLTDGQAMFLYKNIDALVRGVGLTKTFNILIDELLTPSNIPLNTYNIRHDTSNLLLDGEVDIKFVKRKLNSVKSDATDDDLTFEEVTTLQSKLAVGNDEYYLTNADKVKDSLRYTKFNDEDTKLIESSLIDTSKSSYISRRQLEVSNFIYSAANDLLNNTITITNPYNADTYQLDIKDSLILWAFTYYKSIGITLSDIPTFDLPYVKNEDVITLSYIKSKIPSGILTDAEITELISKIIPNRSFLSLDEYSTYIDNLFIAAEQQYVKCVSEEDLRKRNVMFYVCDLCFETYEDVVIGVGTYSDWLSNKKIDLTELSRSDYEVLSDTIFTIIYRYLEIDDSKSLTNVHTSMISIMELLSSYMVQYRRQTNDGTYNKIYLGTMASYLNSIDANQFLNIPMDPIKPIHIVSDSTIASKGWDIEGLRMSAVNGASVIDVNIQLPEWQFVTDVKSGRYVLPLNEISLNFN